MTRVNYEVEETRVGQKTNYDKLTMEIWTDGTVTPEMALVEAAKILRKHLNPFVGYTTPGPEVAAAAVEELFAAVEAPLESRLGMLVSDLRFRCGPATAFSRRGSATFVILWAGPARSCSPCGTPARRRLTKSKRN